MIRSVTFNLAFNLWSSELESHEGCHSPTLSGHYNSPPLTHEVVLLLWLERPLYGPGEGIERWINLKVED